jgi:hypothetical protein
VTPETHDFADDHAAVRAGFPAYRLGLLDAERAQALRVHVRDCAACRAAFEPFAETTSEEEDRPGHVALAILARWDRALAALPPAECELLEAHVAACKRCADSRAFARSLPAPAARPGRAPWRLRVSLGAGAAIAAVLAIVVLRGTRANRPGAESPSPGARPVTTPAPTRSGGEPTSTRPATTAAPVTLGKARRSGAGQVVVVTPGTTALPLRVPPLLGVGPAARIEITVTGPGGTVLGRADLPHRALFGENAPPALEARAAQGSTLTAGPYDVRVVSDAPDPANPGAFEQADYGFLLEVGPESSSTR